MSRISFAQVNSISDPLDQSSFELLIGNVPIAGETLDLTIKTQTASIPGMSTEVFETMLHGHVIKVRGRKVYPRTLSTTMIEDSVFGTTNKIRQWSEFIAGSESGNSQGFRADYAVDAQLIVYNTKGDPISRTIFENFFPQEISDTQLDGSSSAVVSVSVTWSYDRIVSPMGHPLL